MIFSIKMFHPAKLLDAHFAFPKPRTIFPADAGWYSVQPYSRFHDHDAAGSDIDEGLRYRYA